MSNSLETITQVLFHEVTSIPTDNNQVFTPKEIYDTLRRRFFGLLKEQKRLTSVLQKLSTRILSTNRATKMAEDVFVQGGFKKLRENFRFLEKKEKYLRDDQYKLEADMEAFKKLSVPNFWQNTAKNDYEKTAQNLKERSDNLSKQIIILDELRISLEKESIRLTALCSTPEAKNKINEITAGILQKNRSISKQYDELNAKLDTVNIRINHIKTQMRAVKSYMQSDKAGIKYKLLSAKTKGDPIHIIANAMAGDTKDIQLVARLNSASLEIEKDWDMMTEAEKDELKLKQLIQDI